MSNDIVVNAGTPRVTLEDQLRAQGIDPAGYQFECNICFQRFPAFALVDIDPADGLAGEKTCTHCIIDEIRERENVPYELTWADIRGERDRRLSASDWSQSPDLPEAKRSVWADYRKALRDVPETFNTPAEVVWPEQPKG